MSKKLEPMATNDAPIACTLGGTDYAERIEWITSLNRDGLLSHERRDEALGLRYATAVRNRVYELVRRESECCAFLTFALDESRGDVRLTITAPERALQVADVVLEPFLASGEHPSTSGLCADPRNGCCSQDGVEHD